MYNDAKRRLKKKSELSMKKETPTSSYINDSSHKYLYKKIEKEIKDAFPCDNFSVLINYA